MGLSLIHILQNPTSGQIKIADNIKTGAILETPAVYPYWSAKRNLKYQQMCIRDSLVALPAQTPNMGEPFILQ